MKRLKEVPLCVLDQIKTDHQRALDVLFTDTHCTYRLPMHVVAMRIDHPIKKNCIERVIVPDIVIHLTKNAFVSETTLNCSGIKYSLQSTHRPFPFGHIYQNSGHVCLGNIFVPSIISCHAPQQPLETLFLYNDRNVNHGGSTIRLNDVQISQLTKYLESVNITLPTVIQNLFKPNTNLVCNDAVWVLSAYVLQTAPSIAQTTAVYTIMQHVFDIIFPPQADAIKPIPERR